MDPELKGRLCAEFAPEVERLGRHRPRPIALVQTRRRTPSHERQKAGACVLESQAFDPFSKERFAGVFKDLLEQDAGVRLTI